MKTQVTIGTIWEDRGSGKKFEVTGVNDHIQLSGANQADGYKVMSEKSLRNNYKLVALEAPKKTTVEVPEPTVAQEFKEHLESSTEAPQAPATAPAAQISEQPKELADKPARAPIGRVQLEDGTIITGAKFITDICKQTREDTYKVDSPIRWLQKPAGQALLTDHKAKIVVGEKITK